MSSYLVALTVGDWKCVSDHTDGVKVSVCTVPGKENLAAVPAGSLEDILHYYDSYYGIKYPLPKLDNIAVPDFQAGAMENWGAIIYRETALLVDEKNRVRVCDGGGGRNHRQGHNEPKSCGKRWQGQCPNQHSLGMAISQQESAAHDNHESRQKPSPRGRSNT